MAEYFGAPEAVWAGKAGLATMRFVKFVDMQLSTAQVLALSTAAIEVIPAQGAGNVIVPLGGILAYDHNATAYTDASSTNFLFKYTGGSAMVQKVPAASFCTAAADAIAFFGNTYTITALVPALANTGITIETEDALTLGDGPINIRIAYAVVPTGL